MKAETFDSRRFRALYQDWASEAFAQLVESEGLSS
jgi:hypothetical protein